MLKTKVAIATAIALSSLGSPLSTLNSRERKLLSPTPEPPVLTPYDFARIQKAADRKKARNAKRAANFHKNNGDI